MKSPVITVFVVLTLSLSVLAQETIVLYPEELIDSTPYQGISDTILVSGLHKKLNYGGAASLWIGDGNEGGGTSMRRSLIKFDLHNIPLKGKKVARATLTLYCLQVQGKPFDWAVYSVSSENADWAEGTNVKGKAETGLSSWDNRSNFDQPWIGGGGLGNPGEGYESTPLYTGISPTHNKEVINIDLPVSQIERWLDGENGGLLLRMADENMTDSFFRLASSENEEKPLRPTLEITLQP